MEFKCPECFKVFENPGLKIDLESLKENPINITCKCGHEYDGFDNIEYKPPTGGTGEIDPNKSILPEISLRDYFAGQALIGYVLRVNENIITPSDVARKCGMYADAMLQEREK